MSRPRCLDPERIIPISRSSTRVFKTGNWSGRRPVHLNKVSPCRVACPVGNDIPRALERASRGDWDGALTVFLEENPLPGVCGRVCYHPCETHCNRGDLDGAVLIRALERAAADAGRADPSRLCTRGRDQPVAVVGAGPAGLAATYHLARLGHPVTLLDAGAEPGGMLRRALPDYRLPREALARDLARILALGVDVRTQIRVDANELNSLLREHRAVFLAPGADRSISLEIPGTESDGVMIALDFLSAVKEGQISDLHGRAVVIGGGNVAFDAAMTARRRGAAEVEIVCLESSREMPAHDRERQDAQEEGIAVRSGWGARRILARKNGRVRQVEFIRCSSVFDTDGRFAPTYDEAEILTRPADWLIMAVGQTSGLMELAGDLTVDPHTLASERPGLFAGGDGVSGPSSVAAALAAGKCAAASIHLRLHPDEIPEGLSKTRLAGGPAFSIQALFSERPTWDPTHTVHLTDMDLIFVDRRCPAVPSRMDPAARVKCFAEFDLGLAPVAAQAEAGRCLNCGTCVDCDRCLLFCPDLSVIPPEKPGGSYRIDDEYCKGCGVCAAICYRGVLRLGDGQ